jgi:hypothetical protein
MSLVKRYEPVNSDGTCGVCVEDADYGAYVEYADYDTLRTANQRLEGEVARLLSAITESIGLIDLIDKHPPVLDQARRTLQAALAGSGIGQTSGDQDG